MEVLDGPKSNMFNYFKSLLLKGLLELRKHVDSIMKIVSIMEKGVKFNCFDNPDLMTKLYERFCVNKNEYEFIKVVNELISSSYDNWRTIQYDNFQRMTNDICP